MKPIKKIVSVDRTGLVDSARQALEGLAEEVVYFEEDPATEEEVIARAEDAQVLLVSWRTPIRREVISRLPKLKYIGMCCSLYDEKSANVDIAYARELGIPVYGVKDYGDEGLVEFIMASLISLFHGFGRHQWSEMQEELTGKVLGVVGIGATGQMLADRALAFGMDVVYYSRTRKPEIEHERLRYLPLHELMATADVVSTHVPKFTQIVTAEAFSLMKEKSVLVNTSLEPTFDLAAFDTWIQGTGHYAIFDRGGLGAHLETLTQYDRVLYTEKVTGFTHQATYRLSKKVVDNLERYLATHQKTD